MEAFALIIIAGGILAFVHQRGVERGAAQSRLEIGRRLPIPITRRDDRGITEAFAAAGKESDTTSRNAVSPGCVDSGAAVPRTPSFPAAVDVPASFKPRREIYVRIDRRTQKRLFVDRQLAD